MPPPDFPLEDDVFETPTAPQYPTASKGLRLTNLLVDYAARIACTYLLTNALLGAMRFFGARQPTLDPEDPWVLFANIGLAFAVVVLYYTLFEYHTGGRSLGKYVTGTRAVFVDGGRLTLLAAFKRSLWRVVPFEPFSFLGEAPGWHDRQTATKVVDLRGERR